MTAFDAIEEASGVPLAPPRASQTAVRDAIAADPLLRCKFVFLREMTRKMLVHIEYFESAKPIADQVYARLISVQNGFDPLFQNDEVEIILTVGRCPPALAPAMRDLIRVVTNAARNDWTNKMINNQDDETIALYQMIAFFDPLQKAAFAFTIEEILDVIRPIHDSIYPPEPRYDPLLVLYFPCHLHEC